MRITKPIGTLLAAAALCLGFSEPSHAAVVPASVTMDYQASWGGMYFEASGDIFTIDDEASDGYGIYGEVSTTTEPGVFVYAFTDSSGFGTTASKSASNGGKYDLNEGQLYTFTVCKEKGGVVDNASCVSRDATA